MKRISPILASLFFICSMNTAAAADQYDPVPAKGAKQYNACIKYANENYDGGKDKSPIAGQSKAEAYCTCMWSESEEGFEGNLVKFGQTSEGKKINAACEKYSNWRS